jgi:hypothetical protein
VPPGARTDPIATAELICSARGCRAAARYGLHWRNPALHDPSRRKTWLACADHQASLAEFLAARAFLIEVEELDDGPVPPIDPAG